MTLPEYDPLAPIEAALDDEGLLFRREDDDEAMRISFKSEGDRYFIIAYRDDAEFLMLGSGWALPTQAPLERAFAIANGLNARKKLVKTAIWEEDRDALFTVELCLSSYDDFGDHLVRLLEALRDTTADFFVELRGGEV
jgi:hypothetical protein